MCRILAVSSILGFRKIRQIRQIKQLVISEGVDGKLFLNTAFLPAWTAVDRASLVSRMHMQ